MIEWTEQATRQLDQAHDYIALSNSEEVAARITMQIVATVQQLAAFHVGRAGRVAGTRAAGYYEYTLYRRLRHPEGPHRDPGRLPRRTAMAPGLLGLLSSPTLAPKSAAQTRGTRGYRVATRR